MLIPILMVLAGLGLLLGGGELLVRGACTIALRARVAPAVVGLTVVAAGTSMPELVVSLSAALGGTPDMAMGNIVGSNIYNIALILGLTSVVQVLRIEGSTVKLEWPILFLCACLLHLLGRDGVIDQLEGLFFVAGLVAFISWTVYIARTHPSEESEEIWEDLPQTGDETTSLTAIIQVLVGGGLLALGAQAMVSGGVTLANLWGVSERIIGLTILALGTSMPELVASMVAAWKGKADIAVANVIGSNLFNTLGILGATAAITPVPVNARTLSLDNPVMIGLTFLLFPLMRRKMSLGRAEGVLLLMMMVAYSALLYLLPE
jgi:cation:H+ antiporter